jgi:alpha-glucosidase
LIGEIYLPIQQLMTYYGKDNRGVNLPFNFQLLQCAWSADAVARVLSDYDAALPAGAWPNWVLGNHDQPRVASRVGPHQAAVAAMLLLTLPGTLTLYYGEEIGMTNAAIPPEEVQDPAEKNEPGIGQGRDPERTPMQWDSTPLAGFTTAHPWLPLADNHARINVAAQDRDPHSMLTLYRDLTRLRITHRVLVDGTMRAIAAEGHVLRYQRSSDAETLLALLNFSHEEAQATTLPGRIVHSTHANRIGGDRIGASLTLQPAEGLIVLLDKPTNQAGPARAAVTS